MSVEVSVVIPCLNEEKTLGICIRKAQQALKELGIDGEVIVSDNGSVDHSVEIAQALGARVVFQPLRGYGNALRKGIEEARGKYIIMGDADDSYDFSEIGRLIVPLRNGYDLVLGSRLKGRIMRGAMPWHHRWIGNPLFSTVLRSLFKSRVSDAFSGMRSFTRDAFNKLRLVMPGMEFAIEMMAMASKAGLNVTEIPIVYYRDGRDRSSHLRSFRDGWRTLKFMLMFSPTYLFTLPGLTIFGIGLFLMLALLAGPVHVGPLRFDIHWMVLGSFLTILGFQIVNLGFSARIYTVTHRFQEEDPLLEWLFRWLNLERGLVIGAALFLIGFSTDFLILYHWIQTGFGALNAVRPALFGSTLMAIGVQTIFSSFFISILGEASKYGPRK